MHITRHFSLGRIARTLLTCMLCLSLNLHAQTTAPAKEAKPGWSELNAQQQAALAPIQQDWSTFNEARKKKWLAMAENYNKLPQEQQKRMQERMRTWASMTTEQRMRARENLVRTQKLHPSIKNEHWQQYQQLPDERKQALAAAAKRKRSITNLPAQNDKNTPPLPPIKAAAKAHSASLPTAQSSASQAAAIKP